MQKDLEAKSQSTSIPYHSFPPRVSFSTFNTLHRTDLRHFPQLPFPFPAHYAYSPLVISQAKPCPALPVPVRPSVHPSIHHALFFHSPSLSTTRHRHHHSNRGTDGGQLVVANGPALAPVLLLARRLVPAAHRGFRLHGRVHPRRRVPLRLEENHGPTGLVRVQFHAQTIRRVRSSMAAASARWVVGRWA